ncbi:unnamed protein product [Mucor hiemalis]
MVYLLKTISLNIPEFVISLVDNNGDVLLIEAALELPSWLDPSNSENRVYLHQGQVHIIPLPTSPADILQMPSSGQLLRSKAIDHVRTRHNTSLATPPVQKAILQRIDDYPAASHKEIHRATCLLPNKAAFVLLSEPQLITLAIEAFYLRDPISLKACASMKTFSPSVGTIETTVKFTKTTYAQTVSQKFYAPKPFRLPSINQKKQYRFAELGMKVACGLEMLYSTWREEELDTAEEYDFENDQKYKAYVTHLTKLGYFKSERKGSQLYNFLEKQSKEQYLEYKREEVSNMDSKRYVSLNDIDVDDRDTFKGSYDILSNGSSNVRQRIDALLSQYSDEALEKLLESNKDTEDSDDWMNVDPQQLEELLMKRMGNMKESMMADLEKDFGKEKDLDLEAMMSNLEDFVENSKSGVDGVEFPNDKDESDSEDESDYDDDEEGAIQFDMEKFMSILKGESHFKQEEEQDLSQVMEEMDQEVYSHDKISGSFAKLSTEAKNDDEEEDESAPVDVQLNLVKNVLESFKSQQGLPGPVGNLLNQFGFVLPGDNEAEE